VLNFCLAANHKGRSHKIVKNYSPPPDSQNVRTSSPPVCAESDVFCTKKCRRPHLRTPLFVLDKPSPPLTADVFLWTASYSDFFDV